MPDTTNLMQWHIVTKAQYTTGVPVDSDMYFISDTHEIYRGTDSYTKSVELYTDTPPVTYALDRLYINSATLEGKICGADGTWTTVIRPLTDTVVEDGVDPVTGKAVAAYVATKIAEVTGSGDVVTGITWDDAEHLLSVTKGGSNTETILFDGLGVSLTYENGIINLIDASGNALGDPINVGKETFVKSGEYDPVNQDIILYFDEDKKESITIPVGALIDTYTVAETSSITMHADTTNNIFSATLKISSTAGNAITVDDHGVFVEKVDLSGLMNKISGGVAGNIPIIDENGQLVDSGLAPDDIVTTHKLFQGASIEEAVGTDTPAEDDVCIIKDQIGTSDNYQYTAYIYKPGIGWVATDGNYNAENVYFATDLTTTSAIGNVTLTNGQATIAAAGKNLKQVWETIFVQAKNPTITQPAVTVNLAQAGRYEAGTTVTPSYTATLSTGSYQYGPVTGVTATGWTVTDTAGHSATTNTGSFDAFQVIDTTSYRISATATYDDAAIPVNNLGTEYPAGQIKAGSKSGNSNTITAYRAGFYGTLSTAVDEFDSDTVRGLATKTNAAPAQGTVWNIPIPEGARRMIFAYPATIRNVSSVIDVGGMNADITSSFTQHLVDVEGADGYTAISYKVYVANSANPYPSANTYKVTL